MKDKLIKCTCYGKINQRYEVIYLRKSAGKMFIGGFIKSFFIIFVLIIIGVIIYQAVIHLWKPPAAEAVKITDEKKTVPGNITVASIDDISKNLIYGVNDKTGKIDKILLEILNCKNEKLHYITIPVDTRFTMSDSLYRKLVPVNPAIPQLLKLSGISKYFDKNTKYDYGVLLLEDLLKIKISYYTVIPLSIYETIFTGENLTADGADGETERAVPTEVFSDDYKAFLKTLKTTEDLSNYIEELYPSLRSNLSLNEKMSYFDSYSNMDTKNIFFELIKGKEQNSGYMIDDDQAFRQLARCSEP
jgi:hypothetical protein